MTIVTTSRKAADDLRALARHLAFATGARYLARGKTGFAALSDEAVILFTREHGTIRFAVVGEDGTVVLDAPIRSVRIAGREGPIDRTLRVADQSVYDVLKRYCDAAPANAGAPSIVFDGQQKKQIVLELAQ
ncbi:MAG: small nucleolar ribonucleoprotein [Methanofollis sp.]|nr:small nucleolar ribonucleoprotein [Methanofollis sp.]